MSSLILSSFHKKKHTHTLKTLRNMGLKSTKLRRVLYKHIALLVFRIVLDYRLIIYATGTVQYWRRYYNGDALASPVWKVQWYHTLKWYIKRFQFLRIIVIIIIYRRMCLAEWMCCGWLAAQENDWKSSLGRQTATPKKNGFVFFYT